MTPITDPILHSLLTNTGTLATRLQTASQQLGAMFAAGELDALDVDTRLQLRGLQMFLVGAAGDATDMENEILRLEIELMGGPL